MKKIAIAVIALSGLLIPASAQGAGISGTPCKTANSTKTSSSIKYTCVKSKGKLIWNKGVAVTKPAVSSTPTVEPTVSATPEVTTSSPTPSATAEIVKDVTAGAFCAPAGANGLTKTGLQVTCKTSATDTRNRWRQ